MGLATAFVKIILLGSKIIGKIQFWAHLIGNYLRYNILILS